MADRPTAITPQQVADELGYSLRTVYRWIDSGELPTVKPGNHHRIFEHHLAEKIGEEEARVVFDSVQEEEGSESE